MRGSLPKGWARAELGDLVRCIRPRIDPVLAGVMPYIGMEHVESQTRKLLGTVPAQEMKSSAFHFHPDDVLYGRLRPYLNKVLHVNFEGLCSSEFICLTCRPVVTPSFLAYLIMTDEFVEFANQLNTGDRPRVNFEQISKYVSAIPPVLEQRRIVAKLEALLAEVDTSRKRLERIPTILKRFRQAVLAAAVEGRLTEAWRQANPQEERTETTLGEVAIEFRTGPFGSSLHQSDYVRGGIPVINPTNILNGSLVSNEDVTVSEETFGRLSDYALKVGDIIIARRGEMGRCAVVGEKECGWLCGTGSALVRLKRVAIPAFIQAFISAPPTRQFLIEGAVGTTMANLNQGIFKSVPISLPSGPEQVEILRRLSELDALADQIEARYLKAKTHVDRLTQSILAKAFRGELVPQDPNDEPAEMLLARLKAQPADATSPKRRGRPKKAAG